MTTRIKHRAKRLMQGEELRRARDLYVTGVALRKIADGLGRSERTVHDSLVAFGVNMRGRGRRKKPEERTKVCRRCGPPSQSWTAFHLNTNGRPLAYCRLCQSEYERERRKERRDGTMHRKACTRCKHEKPIAGFNRNRTTPDGRAYWCKDCTRRDNQLNPARPLRRVTNVTVPAEPAAELPERDSVVNAILNKLIKEHTPFLLRPGPMRYVSIDGVAWRRE